jgi:hypothetical protein
MVRTVGQGREAVHRLELQVGYPTDWPDEVPEFAGVKILIDGQEPLTWAGSRGPYRGPWPPVLLADDSPLVPGHPPRRTLLYIEGMHEPYEGTITAVIRATKSQVVWGDFRECSAAAALDADGAVFGLCPPSSTQLSLPDLAFDLEQYLAEVRRAIADRDWESDRWRTARLLDDYLGQAIRDRGGLSGESFYPSYAEPADDAAGFLVTFWGELVPRHGLVVALTADPGTPEARARSMTDTLMATAVDEWPVVRRLERPR